MKQQIRFKIVCVLIGLMLGILLFAGCNRMSDEEINIQAIQNEQRLRQEVKDQDAKDEIAADSIFNYDHKQTLDSNYGKRSH